MRSAVSRAAMTARWSCATRRLRARAPRQPRGPHAATRLPISLCGSSESLRRTRQPAQCDLDAGTSVGAPNRGRARRFRRRSVWNTRVKALSTGHAGWSARCGFSWTRRRVRQPHQTVPTIGRRSVWGRRGTWRSLRESARRGRERSLAPALAMGATRRPLRPAPWRALRGSWSAHYGLAPPERPCKSCPFAGGNGFAV
jgi:hypothetical protein